MLRFSTNLTAEVLGLTSTAARLGAPPSSLAASAAEMTGWAGAALGMTSSRFADHSGLSDESRTTAGDLASAMRTLGVDGALRPLLRGYSLSDEAGRPEPMVVEAKTGTLNFVSALAGYILPEDGPPMVFAIQTADLSRRAAIPVGDEDNPPGNASWVGRSRRLQFDLVKLWGRHAATDPDLAI
jgi:D-alanyl-D-alanine carboxypeptidase/D-alanyl-D-alanine-endopeptidase (penicillin-binding protein 4)